MPVASLFDLSVKVALVAGGKNGIGLGKAEGLDQHTAAFIIRGTKKENNEPAAAQPRNHSGNMVVIGGGVTFY
ncbi:hypothetical protein [Novosphingobium sp.]|uniref:hypothetical protein n=1 Tax=Novosphingobium sp. TaxID=1874826 RepID=UPI0025DAF068|nr:hypothetical protein [Novosphingobium sp.]